MVVSIKHIIRNGLVVILECSYSGPAFQTASADVAYTQLLAPVKGTVLDMAGRLLGSVAAGGIHSVGSGVGNGVVGAMAGGFAGAATGSYLNGARGWDVADAGFIGAAVGAAAYGVQAGYRYSQKTGDVDFDNVRNRIAMSREAEKSFRFKQPLCKEHGGWFQGKNDPDIWTERYTRSIRPTPMTGDETGEFHTHAWEQGYTQRHSVPNDITSVTNKSFVINRQEIWSYYAGQTTDYVVGPTSNYLTAFTFNIYYYGY